MMIAMEVLHRVVPFASSSSSYSSLSCAIPQCCSSSASKSCPSSVPIVQAKSSSVVASLVGSLIASVPPSLAANYTDFVTDTAQPVQSAAIDVASNPTVLIAGVAAAVAVPLIAFQAYAATPQSFGSVSPVAAFAALSEPNAQLLDIRCPEDARASGSPNLKSLRKKPVQVVYESEVEAFVEKVVAKYRDAETTTLYVLDGSDGNALVVAKLLANNGFQSAFAISGGIEGWQENELPWLEPWKGFNLNIDGLKNLFSGSDNSSLAPTTLGAAAAAGLAVAVFAEAETVLQLLGSAAFIQIFAKRFMFADDREKTLNEIQTFLDTKVAPKEFASELKEVGRILIPNEGEGNKAALARGNAVVKQKDLKEEDPSLTPEFKTADQGS